MGKLKNILVAIFLFIIVFNAQSQNNFKIQFADSALSLTKQNVNYDPSYYSIDYPNGDIPSDKGVCTDVVIRAYRKIGIDLQELVHLDMKENFKLYPQNWGMSKPDKNIDHRRVPNLMVYFTRFGKKLPKTKIPTDYKPGEIVCWSLGSGITHIGIVSNKKSNDKSRYLIIHNIGAGQVLEDCLFDYNIIGHFEFVK
jgi:uncharacterized protein YijF (DUF1287 family)